MVRERREQCRLRDVGDDNACRYRKRSGYGEIIASWPRCSCGPDRSASPSARLRLVSTMTTPSPRYCRNVEERAQLHARHKQERDSRGEHDESANGDDRISDTHYVERATSKGGVIRALRSYAICNQTRSGSEQCVSERSGTNRLCAKQPVMAEVQIRSIAHLNFAARASAPRASMTRSLPTATKR
jgi:hypothetical protein